MIDAAKLKSYVDRIERLMEERDGILADIRDIYTEAKGHDVVPKVLRKVIVRRRAKDKAALLLEDDLLDTYLAALDGPTRKAVEMAAAGATSRQIQQATGIDHVTVSRSVSLKNKTDTAVDGGVANLASDGGAPVATSTVGPAVTTPEIPWEITGGSVEPLTDEDKRRLKIERDALDIPYFLRRTA
jgi:uncharacterized protein (UPF0335 family)